MVALMSAFACAIGRRPIEHDEITPGSGLLALTLPVSVTEAVTRIKKGVAKQKLQITVADNRVISATKTSFRKCDSVRYEPPRDIRTPRPTPASNRACANILIFEVMYGAVSGGTRLTMRATEVTSGWVEKRPKPRSAEGSTDHVTPSSKNWKALEALANAIAKK